VVIRTGRTIQEQLAQSLGNLEKVKGRVLGAVLNYVPTRGTDAYSYYGTYTSAPAPAAEADPQPVAVPNVHEADRVLEAVPGGRRAKG